MATEPLCVGDVICLYSEESNGYVFALQSTKVHSDVAVSSKQARVQPPVSDPRALCFHICVANRYKLNKRHRKLLEKSLAEPNDIALKNAVSKAKISADAEEEDNSTEQKRQEGKQLLYGQVIQLRHEFTDKYISASTTLTSKSESSNMLVELLKHNSKHALFRVMPRYKVKAEGDVIYIGDQIVLESIKSPGQFLHVSRASFPSQYVYSTMECNELALSVRQSGFTIYRHYKAEKGGDCSNYIRGCVPVRLFHKEIEAYLVAEGLFDDEVTDGVHFRLRPLDQTNPKTLFPSSSAITYWQFEHEENNLDGEVIHWEQQVRIRHMITRQYLMVDKAGTPDLTADRTDPLTVFQLHSVIKEKTEVEADTYCRIQHVVTKKWISAAAEPYSAQWEKSARTSVSMSSLRWTSAQLTTVKTDDEMKYDDAFTLQFVGPELSQIFNFMAGCVPFIQKLISDRRKSVLLNAKQAHEIVLAFDEMCEFMIEDGIPEKNRQKLLRNMRIVELIVRLLQTVIRGAKDVVHLEKIFVKAYDVLYNYLKGDSRKNELYIARHIDFFQTQISYRGSIGLNAAQMVMELVKDNRKIVDRISHEQIDEFISLLSLDKNYQYLELLNVLCVCDGVSISDNQEYITRQWLMSKKKNVVYLTELGQSPKVMKEKDVVYVSTNDGRIWKPLREFVYKSRETDEGRKQFNILTHQLDLFGKLCYGRNQFAIEKITKELQYLTWQEAYLCLSDEKLPDDLRAKYCELIIGMFVDIEDNVSVLNRIKLTFVYDDVNDNADDEFQGKSTKSQVTESHFPQLRDWIASFLDKNRDMTASLIGHNMLVEQVLRLVHYLVMYGYYGNTQDIKRLLEPLLSLLDGRNDKPYPKTKGQTGNEFQVVLEHYQKTGRYQKSLECTAVVDAKYRAMQVLELFFNFRFNTRLERFVYQFKQTHAASMTIHGHSSWGVDLGALLYETFDEEEQEGACRSALRVIDEIFRSSDYFSRDTDLVAILVDLSDYNYDKMLIQAMALLNRYYSAHDTLFKRAIQAQVLVTDQSIQTLNDVGRMLPILQRLTKSKINEEQAVQMVGILDKLSSYCSLEDDPSEPHPMNQRILYNFNLLTDIFDVLSKEFDVKLIEQYKGMRTVLQRSCRLLQVLSRGNETMQTRLFDRIDFLLSVKGAESEIARALTEVFTGNKSTCMKVLSYQIQKIMQLAAEHGNTTPHFLDLLSSIVKVEELNLPLKRNQGYVMKYFMQYRSEVARSVDAVQGDRLAILKGEDTTTLQYLLSMVDLLSTCAEGENRFIESICQTIFSLPDLLEILINADAPTARKRPFLRFLLWVYLNTAGGLIESGAGDLPHDEKMWIFISNVIDGLKELSTFVSADRGRTKRLLKEAPSANSESSDPTVHGLLHFYFDAVLPSFQVFFRQYYAPSPESYPNELQVVDALANGLIIFSEAVNSLVSNPTYLKALTGCTSSVLSASTVSLKVMEKFQEQFGSMNPQGLITDSRKAYNAYFNHEEELNVQLNVFSANYARVYGGKNTVRDQMDYNSSREYTDLDGHEILPLGREFQDHVACFLSVAIEAKGKYTLAEKLVQQLDISTRLRLTNERDRIEQEDLDIKSLQLLRAMIHNEVVKLPAGWQEEPNKHARQLIVICSVQNALNDHEAILKILPHLSKNRDDLIREILAFMAAMLYGGNAAVQQGIIDYFYGTREEKFFYAIRNRMNLSSIAYKEHRSLIAQYQAKVDEAIEMAKALKRAMATGNIAEKTAAALGTALGRSSMQFSGSRMSINSMQGSLIRKKKKKGKLSLTGSYTSLTNNGRPVGPPAPPPANNKVSPLQNGKEKTDVSLHEVKVTENDGELDAQEIAEIEASAAEEMDVDYTDEGYIDLVLRVLGLMCDGQNQDLQNYLREQPDNIKSFNLVGETSRFLQLMYSNINRNSITLVTEVVSTLTEFSSGNLANQMVIFDNKVCDYINYILRNRQFTSCTEEAMLDMLEAMAILIVAMTEENRGSDVKGGKGAGNSAPGNQTKRRKAEGIRSVTMVRLKEVVQAFAVDSIHEMVMMCYEKAQGYQSGSDLRESYGRVGFKYYHLLRRFEDVDDDFNLAAIQKRAGQSISPEIMVKALQWYQAGTLSIEILKDSMLQKLYFRVRDKTVLREEVIDKFKYEVDRTSPTNKLREFLNWSRDIMHDIKYQKRILANPIGLFFVKGWAWFNILIIWLSFLIGILVLVTWEQPTKLVTVNGNTTTEPDYDSFVPKYRWSESQIITLVLGIIHNFLAFCIMGSYFLSNHPTFPSDTAVKAFCLQTFGKRGKEHSKEDRQSYLEVQFFSFKTFYYMLFFSLSILGTFSYGYFFAFHLMHITENNQLLKRVIQAITKNGLSLLWVFILGLIVFYIYALLSFAFYRSIYDKSVGLYCTNMYECFTSVVHRGLIISTFEYLEETTLPDQTFTWHLAKAFFDISFFILVTTIGLNMIFGIIVDTFSELRDSKWQIDQDMRNTCFICSRESYDFEHNAGGFNKHITEEHDIWAYLFFFIHLSDTRSNDYSALELYCSRLLERDNIGFFPLNRAMSLEDEEDKSDVKFDTLLKHVNYIMTKIKEQEVVKLKEQEERKQQEWVKQHAKH